MTSRSSCCGFDDKLWDCLEIASECDDWQRYLRKRNIGARPIRISPQDDSDFVRTLP